MTDTLNVHPQMCRFTQAQCERFGRQMILPQIGEDGMSSLLKAKVLVIGAGGLGSPICLYLSASGIGHLTIVDGDDVSTSNLHRQVIHGDDRVGMNKAVSAVSICKQLNPLGSFAAVTDFLTPNMAHELFPKHDIIVDATDNAFARYLINDAAVIFKKTLVSGSALRWEGQLCIYNHLSRPFEAPGPRGKPLGAPPCYRCLFPAPPPTADDAGACDKHGVVGTAPGLLGIMQAHETIKIAAGLHDKVLRKLLIFDGLEAETPIRGVWVRGRKENCPVCGIEPSITDVREFDYDAFITSCDVPPSMSENQKIDAGVFMKEFLTIVDGDFMVKTDDVLVVDVRPRNQVSIIKLPGASNIPLEEFGSARKRAELPPVIVKSLDEGKPIFVICRRGNDSRIATKLIWAACEASDAAPVAVRDVTKGLTGMRAHDPSIPIV
eukprot:GDKJ01023140.1.p1 GENE.GDKJ01023140.1~~GDKJ01023140.1.p1  ORF type:complete len:436 (-),score=67.19 GDKJ01023140.1:229-1536(-)